jgi:hypothetical protein
VALSKTERTTMCSSCHRDFLLPPPLRATKLPLPSRCALPPLFRRRTASATLLPLRCRRCRRSAAKLPPPQLPPSCHRRGTVALLPPPLPPPLQLPRCLHSRSRHAAATALPPLRCRSCRAASAATATTEMPPPSHSCAAATAAAAAKLPPPSHCCTPLRRRQAAANVVLLRCRHCHCHRCRGRLLVGCCVVHCPILSCHCMLSCDLRCSVAGHFPP